MSKRPPQHEYRFDLVEPAEWESCFDWELFRESRRQRTLLGSQLQPWLKLGPKRKTIYEESCGFRCFSRSPAVTIPPPAIFGSNVEAGDSGEEYHSRQVVEIRLEGLVDWKSSDPQILGGLWPALVSWLEEQRRNNPNARHFKGKANVGAREKPLAALLKLAVWRLECRYALDLPAIEKKVSRMLWLLESSKKGKKRVDAPTMDLWEQEGRVASLSGNKSKYLKDIDVLLFWRWTKTETGMKLVRLQTGNLVF